MVLKVTLVFKVYKEKLVLRGKMGYKEKLALMALQEHKDQRVYKEFKELLVLMENKV